MTAITEPNERSSRTLDRLSLRLRTLAQTRTDEPAWVAAAFVGVVALAAVLYLWNLTISGYANQYYSAAALAASKSWSAWFFGSFDSANFITVDKPPLNTMLMGLSVRLLGLSSWSILLPEALAGIATVAVLFVTVRRSFGPAAAGMAGLFMAITPASVLIFRFNNPDALLTLLLVTSAYALLRSLDHGSFRWVVAAAGLVGLAFLTKYLQAYLVLPGYALVFGFAANTTLRRRIAGLGLALATVLVTSGWWVALVQLIPVGSRPFIGGSSDGSALDLIFGYDGLGRIFGAGRGPGVGGAGGGFGGAAGLLRLFNDQWFGQISWFIPLAIVGLVVGLAMRYYAERTDRGLAGYLLWGTWFVVTAVVLSYMDGIVHTYYAVALAPAVAALSGAGLADLWKLRHRIWIGPIAVGAAILGTAWFGWQQLQRTPDFGQAVGPIAVVLALAALAILAIVAIASGRADLPAQLRTTLGRAGVAAAALGLVAAILAPGAYAIATTGNAYGGGDPHPGPGAPSGFGFGGFGGGFGGRAPAGATGAIGGGRDGFGGVDSALLDYLVANRGTATWIVAANGANEAGPIELETGLPVMAMGGFSGSDPAPTLSQLRNYVASGQLRFVLVGRGGFGGFGGGSESQAWVASSCQLVTIPGSSATVYDCAAAK